jgi:hypothetical protein
MLLSTHMIVTFTEPCPALLAVFGWYIYRFAHANGPAMTREMLC